MRSLVRKSIAIAPFVAAIIALGLLDQPEKNSLEGWGKGLLTCFLMFQVVRIMQLEPVVGENDGRIVGGLKRWIFWNLLHADDTKGGQASSTGS